MFAAFAPTSDQRTQGQETCGSGSSADFSNTEDSNGVSHCPELFSSATKSVEEAESRHRHDATDASQHQDEASRNLGLVVHFHSAQGEDGKDSEGPASECVDDAVGILQALHGFPRDTHGVVVSSIEVHGVAAAEKHDEEEGKTERGVDADDDLYCQALPFLEQDTVEGDCEGGLEEYICQSVEGELKDLVLVVVST